MLTIGVTGGIGSGKTTVCKVFKVLGVPVFHADQEAKRLQNENNEIKDGLKSIFGSEIYDKMGQLNRQMLASFIFNNVSLLQRVNQLVHPIVHREFETWSLLHHESAYVLYEAAILFETGHFKNFDKTILVLADPDQRLARVLQRDPLTKEAIVRRMQNQMPDSEKIQLADFIIENNDNQMIIPRILLLDNLFKSN
ncbi:MAG: dephospho-CoA kinase [Marinilabiliales bacterium]|nr:dephospho-CoA kinase [Marinilabiliales bacterium]